MQMALRVALLLSAVALAAAATATGPGQGPTQQPPKLATDTLFKPTHPFKPLRVLGFFPFNGFSHFQMLKGVMLALAKKGHHVTTVTPFKIKEAVANYRQIDVSDQFPSLVNRFQFEFASEHLGSRANPFKQIRSMMTLGGEELCRKSFSHPKLQDIYAGKQQYDVIFISMFLSDCLLAIGHKLKIPTVAVSTAANFLWTADFTGDVDNPAFYETMFLPPSKEKLSTFWRRLENTRLYVEGKLAYWWYSTRPCEAVMREFYGEDVPSLAELKRNVSLAIGNSHDILVGPKAMVPRFLPVAGIHLTQPDLSKVPKEIATFLDSATNGVLYFTLGSLVRSDSLPPRIMKALTGAFERLKPLRVLWKYESSAEQARQAGVPDNVMVSSWMPQMEILAHPNVKGFLTHGGLMGSLEALYNGVPMAGIPMFGDQVANVEKFEALGIAVALDHRTIDEEKVYQAVKKIISDPEIRGNIADLSFRFRDRAVAPGDAVVWWTEYVVRHGGAPYLEAPTSSMPFYQYLLLDVVAAVAITLLAGIYLAIKLTSLLFRAIFKRTSASKKKKD